MLKIINKNKVKYIISGIWNTAFSYLVFLALYHYFTNTNYIYLLCASQVIGITNAYIVYKFIVFKTTGNYLKEYLRFYLVYGFSLLLNFLLIIIFVNFFEMNPLLAQGIIAFIVALIGYFGHSIFSFRKRL